MGAVAAPPQIIPVTLSVFGGTDTEISPSDLPEGLSPDNQDFSFLPGETATRPCLHRAFTKQIVNGASVVYQKTYVQRNGQPLNLILTSDGSLWVSDVVNNPAPNVPVLIGSVPPGLYAQSVSAFGREYIAISDLLHGQGVPLQYDGTNLDRVTQDGPGAPPTVADETSSYPLLNSPNGTIQIGPLNVQSGSEVGFLITLILSAGILETAVLKSFRNGDQFLIAGVGAGYNGTVTVQSVVDAGSGNIAISYLSATSGLSPVGVAGTASLPYYQIVPNIPFTQLFQPPVNSMVTLAGVGVAAYNSSWQVRYNPPGVSLYVMIPLFNLANSGGGTISMTGNVSVGAHQCVVIFLTRNGALTQPSPPVTWQAAGGHRVLLNNLPIGPPDVVARVLGFTGAGGDNFFILPASVTIPQPTGQPIIIAATVVPDNTSNSAILDFTDNALFDGIAIDQIGNDLFDQRVLGPVLGFFAFADRLVAWGDSNKIENFLNMGFNGGYLLGQLTQPLGWTVEFSGGSTLIFGGPWASGMAWQVTGALIQNARLSQSAYQDAFGTAILQPLTQYTFRIWAQVNTAPIGGNIKAELFSPTSGTLATALIPCTSAQTVGGFLAADFSAKTPAVIPADTLLRLSVPGLTTNVRLLLSENEVIFTQNPYHQTAGVSYVLNPEAFAQTTGNLGPADDSSPIQNFSLQRNVGLLHTGEAAHEFQDNGNEPGDGNNAWPVNSLTHSVGALSLRACDPGKFGTGDAAEDWDLIASKNGLYLNLGASFWKVSQEMSRTVGTAPTAVTYDDINFAFQHTVWVKNFVNKRFALIGAPVNGATAPNVIFVLDYREMDTAAQIAAALPIHITLSGKMKSSDMTRKWSRWNIAANSAEVMLGPGNNKDLYLGGGSGSTPGTGTAYGNIYTLDPTKFTDDDYGQMSPYYVTYAFIDHDQEQQLQLGSERHLYRHISAFITGVGMVTITPLINSLSNVQPALSLRVLTPDTDAGTFLASDLEWTTNIRGQRVFFRIDVQPLPGSTDVQCKLQKLIISMMKDPVAPFRQSAV